MRSFLKFSAYLAIFLISSSVVLANDYQVNVKIHPLGIFSNSFQAGADFFVDENISVGFTGRYSKNSGISSHSLGLTTRYYKFGMDSDGLYVGAHVVGGNYSGDLEQKFANNHKDHYYLVYPDGATYNLGIMGGYNWIWSSGFNISLGFGIDYVVNPAILRTNEMSNDTITSTKNHHLRVLPNGEFTIGILL